ncbi:MAG: DUF883 C-terminal domain-containing protein [Halioglobus sp.]
MHSAKATGSDSNRSAESVRAASIDREDEVRAGKDAVGEAYERLMEAKAHFQKAAESAGSDLTADAMLRADRGVAKLEEAKESLASNVRENPVRALGIAVVTGFLLSALFSRK